MGKALELISVQATAPGASAAFAAVGGNSLTIRDTQRPVWLGPVWGARQTAGFLRLTSPLLHDAVQGIELRFAAGAVEVELWPPGRVQRLYAQDTLVATGSGSGTAGDIESNSMLIAYEDLPGVDAYLIDERELLSRGEDIYCSRNTLATGTAGGYSGQEGIAAEVDQLKANTDYAILGWSSLVSCAAVRYVSSDWGNLGLGGPGGIQSGDYIDTREWFRRVTTSLGMPAIPVFNSSNKALTFIDAMQDENGGDPIINTILVRLSPKARGRRQ